MAKSNTKSAPNTTRKSAVNQPNKNAKKAATFQSGNFGKNNNVQTLDKQALKQAKKMEKNSKKRTEIEAKITHQKIASTAFSQPFSKEKLISEHEQTLKKYREAKKAIKLSRADQASKFKKARQDERAQYKEELKSLSAAQKQASADFRKRNKEILKKFKAAKKANYPDRKKRRAAILEARRERHIALVQNQDLRKQDLVHVKENAIKFRKRHEAALLDQDTRRIREYELYLQAYNTEVKGSHIRYLNSKKRVARLEKEADLRLKEQRMMADELIRKERFRTHISKLTPDQATKLAKDEVIREKNFQKKLAKIRSKIKKYVALTNKKAAAFKDDSGALAAFDAKVASEIKIMNANKKAKESRDAKKLAAKQRKLKRKEQKKQARIKRKQQRIQAKERKRLAKQKTSIRSTKERHASKAAIIKAKKELKVKKINIQSGNLSKREAKKAKALQARQARKDKKAAKRAALLKKRELEKAAILKANQERKAKKAAKKAAKIKARELLKAKKQAKREAILNKRKNQALALKNERAKQKEFVKVTKAQADNTPKVERADSEKVSQAFNAIVDKDFGSTSGLEKLRFARRNVLAKIAKIDRSVASLPETIKDKEAIASQTANFNIQKSKLVKKERQLAYKIAKIETRLAWKDEKRRFARAKNTLSKWEIDQLKAKLNAKHELDSKKLSDLRYYQSKKKKVTKLATALTNEVVNFEEVQNVKSSKKLSKTTKQPAYIQDESEAKIINQEINESILSAKLAIKEAKKQAKLEAKEYRLKQKRQAQKERFAQLKAIKEAKQNRLDEIAARKKQAADARAELLKKQADEKAAKRAELLKKREVEKAAILKKRELQKAEALKARQELEAKRNAKRAAILQKRQAKKDAIIKARQAKLEAIAQKKAARRRLAQGFKDAETIKLAQKNTSRNAAKALREAKKAQLQKQREHLKTLSGFERKEYLIQIKEQAKIDRLVKDGQDEKAKQLQFIYDMRRKYRLETHKGLITAKQAKIELRQITKEQLIPNKYQKVGTDGIMDSEKRLSVFVPRAISTIREWMRVLAIISTAILAVFIILALVDVFSNSTFIIFAKPEDQQYLTVLGFSLFSAIFIISLFNSIAMLILGWQVKTLKLMKFMLMTISIIAIIFMSVLAIFMIIDKTTAANVIVNDQFDKINNIFTNFGICMINLTFIAFCGVCACMLSIIPFMSKLLTEKMNLGDRLSVLNMSYKDAINYANRLKHDMQMKRDALQLENQEILANIKKLEEMNKMKMFERRLREQLHKQEFIDKVAQMFISEHEEFMNLFAAKNGKEFRQLKRTIIKNLREYRYQQIVGQIEDAITAREKTNKKMQQRVLREGDIKMAFNMFNSAYDVYESDMKKHPNESDFDRFMRLKRGNLTEAQFRALKKELEQEYYASIKPMTNVTDSSLYTEAMKAREYALKPAIFDEKVDKFSYDPLDPTNQAEEVYAIMDGYYPEAALDDKKRKAARKQK